MQEEPRLTSFPVNLFNKMSVNLKNNPIWYKFERRDANMINQLQGRELIHLREAIKSKSELSEAADALILQAKRENETEYIILDADYFQDQCNSSFRELVNTFNIKRSNPIRVTRQGMSLFPFCLLLIFLCYCKIETQQVHSFIYLLSF